MTKFEGSITALVTPFRNGALDEKALAGLIERQIAGGTQGIVAAGSTGESPTLSEAEHERLVRLCVEVARGLRVIAGVGSNDTARAVALAKAAERAGAHGLLAASGYYNKPSQRGLIAHFRAVHDATNLPVLLYNVPSRTGVDLAVETIAELSRLPRIVGLKDATGDIARVARQRLASGPEFTLLSGEDMTAVGFNAMGGRGCISVSANVAPELCARLQAALLNDDYGTALALQDRLTPLHDALFKDTNPGPVKYALALMGACTEDVRLPLVPPTAPVKEQIREALIALGLIGQ